LRETEGLLFLRNTSVVPKASPETLPARATALEPVAPRRRRSTSRERRERSRTGLLTALPRQHCAPRAAAVAGPSTARLPPLLPAATWAPQALDPPRVTTVVAQRPAHGLLGLDDPGLRRPAVFRPAWHGG
jgi:hypothetical protein